MVTAGKQVDIEAQDIVMDGLLKATDMPITIRTCVGRGVTIGGPGQPSPPNVRWTSVDAGLAVPALRMSSGLRRTRPSQANVRLTSVDAGLAGPL